MRVPVFTVGLLVALWAPRLFAQTPMGAPCVLPVDIAPGLPPSMYGRVHAMAAELVAHVSATGQCAARVVIGASREQVTVEVTLLDGRVAQRSLDEPDDLLPTVLAMLAAPPAPVPPPPPPAPPPAPPVPAVAPVVAPPPPAAPTSWTQWPRYAALRTGEHVVNGQPPHSVTYLEAGVLSARWRLAARLGYAMMRFSDPSEEADEEDGRRDRNTAFQLRLGVEAARRWTRGRWSFELGALALLGASWTSRGGVPGPLGVGGTLGGTFRVWRQLHAMLSTDLTVGVPIDAFAVTTMVGARWEFGR